MEAAPASREKDHQGQEGAEVDVNASVIRVDVDESNGLSGDAGDFGSDDDSDGSGDGKSGSSSDAEG
eukprot:376195-Pleurochrysis_carterae.AAC.1